MENHKGKYAAEVARILYSGFDKQVERTEQQPASLKPCCPFCGEDKTFDGITGVFCSCCGKRRRDLKLKSPW